MKRNIKICKWVSLLLAIVMMLSCFAGCKNEPIKDNPNKDSITSSNTTSGNDDNSSQDSDTDSENDSIIDTDMDSDWDDWDDEWDDWDDDSFGFSNELSILNSKPLTENFLGFGGLYNCFSYVEDSIDRGMTQELLDLEMDRLENMQLSIIRSLFQYHWSYDEVKGEWDWDSESMTGFYQWCKEMDERGIDIGIMAGQGPLEITREKDGDGNLNPFYAEANGDADKCREEYANWVVELLKQIRKRGLDNVKYFFLFIEPGDAWSSKDYDYQINSLQPFRGHCIAVDAALKEAGIRDQIKLIGPNIADSLQMYEYCVEDKDLNKVFDIYSWHTYDRKGMYENSYYSMLDDFSAAVNMAKKIGKPLWIDEDGLYSGIFSDYDEYLAHPWHATKNASMMVAAMNAGVQTFIRWSIVDQFWPGDGTTSGEWLSGAQRCGIFPNITMSTIPRNTYYTYSLFTKYCTGNNMKVYEGLGMGDVHLSACQNDNGDWTIVVVNMGYATENIEISFEKAIGKTLYRHVYNPYKNKPTMGADIITPDKNMGLISDTISDTIGGGCVQIYTSIKG